MFADFINVYFSERMNFTWVRDTAVLMVYDERKFCDLQMSTVNYSYYYVVSDLFCGLESEHIEDTLMIITNQRSIFGVAVALIEAPRREKIELSFFCFCSHARTFELLLLL